MDVKLRYRGRSLTEADIAFIRRLMAAHPQASRRALSKKLCEAWQWRQPNGRFCDMVGFVPGCVEIRIFGIHA
jgi:hypothetical protein